MICIFEWAATVLIGAVVLAGAFAAIVLLAAAFVAFVEWVDRLSRKAMSSDRYWRTSDQLSRVRGWVVNAGLLLLVGAIVTMATIDFHQWLFGCDDCTPSFKNDCDAEAS